MSTQIRTNGQYNYNSSSCSAKASLIAAMIMKSTNADLIEFGSSAKYVNYSPNSSVFDLAKSIKNEN
ncbi:MAG: hypothetical protein ACQGQO_08935, partial [Sphaerochaetaceae bacterium]